MLQYSIGNCTNIEIGNPGTLCYSINMSDRVTQRSLMFADIT